MHASAAVKQRALVGKQVAGRFTIKAHLTYYTPAPLPGSEPVPHSVWFKPSHFRLSRP